MIFNKDNGMIRYIRYCPQFEKQCEKLKKSNDKAVKAVDHAVEILSEFKQNRRNFNSMGALTHYGEMRLKDCIKYRLGNGYRLVLSVNNDCLFVLCIGSHDQCDRWLEKNRGGEDFSFSRQEQVFTKYKEKDNSGSPGVSDGKPSEYLCVDDRVLRQIFQGICNSPG